MSVTKEKIIEEALVLLAEEGLEGVSFRKLTKRLGVQAPAIYWRFKEKRELLEAMAQRVLEEAFQGEWQLCSGDWRHWLLEILMSLRAAMLKYPDGARLIAAARPHHTLLLGQLTNRALEVLLEAGVSLPEAATIIFTAFHYTYGRVIAEQDVPSQEDLAAFASREYRELFPVLNRVVTMVREQHIPADEAYYQGIRRIIGGSSIDKV